MRAVALSEKTVQTKINQAFVPLRVVLDAEANEREFPLDWPATKKWKMIYEKTEIRGFTGCSVVSPDLKTEYASTGSAMVWEMFDSVAYDARKFEKMLDQALAFANEERTIREAGDDRWKERSQLARLRLKIFKHQRQVGKMRIPPRGFTVDKAKELFRMTGDLPAED